MSVNKAIILGRLGKDPEIRYTTSGMAVANFSVATSEVSKDKDGQRQEKTEWHNIVVWGKTAEFCKEYLAKGREVYLEGKIQTRKWQDQSGQARYTTEIVAREIKFVGSKSGNGPQAGGGDNFQAPEDNSAPSFVEDEIPF